MAELIKTTDSLNDGRKKLNDAITDSNAALSTANTAKQTANLAKAESESTQTQLDTIVIEGDSSVEAAQARVNNSGTAFPTLKQRLDAEHQEVTAQLQQIAVDVRSFGAIKNQDSTVAIQEAIDYVADMGGGTVSIKENYMIKAHVENTSAVNYLGDEGGIALKDNVVLDLSGGGVLNAIPNDKQQYNVIRVYNKINVTIVGGIINGDRHEHVGTLGEWGYGVAVTGGENIQIKDSTFTNFFGDGLNFQVHIENYLHSYPTNIRISNILCDNNRRQGMSIECMINGVIRDSTFKNTQGIAPECGVDIEPWDNSIPVKNVTFENCVFEGNNESGMLILMPLVSDIKIINCKFINNKAELGQIRTLRGANTITIDNCTIERGESGSENGIVLQDGDNFLVRNTHLKECTIRPLASTDNLVSKVKIMGCKIVFKDLEVTNLFVTPDLSDDIEVNQTLFDVLNSPGGMQYFTVNGKNHRINGNTIIGNREGVSLNAENSVFDSNIIVGGAFSSATIMKPVIFRNNVISESNYKNPNEPVILIHSGAKNTVIVNNIYKKKSHLTLDGSGLPGVIVGFMDGPNNTVTYLLVKDNFVLSDTKIPMFLESYMPVNKTNFLQGENTNTLNGSTQSRPNNVSIGLSFFDSDLGKLINWNGTNWVDSVGTIV